MKATPQTEKLPEFPYTHSKQGVSVTIGRVSKGHYDLFRVTYSLGGKRKQVWRSDFAEAKQAANDAVDAILSGDHAALSLRDSDRHIYLRAVEAAHPTGKPLDVIVVEHAELLAMLNGRATPAEVGRDWLKRHAVELPRITVLDAKDEIIKQARADGKSDFRVKQLSAALARFAKDISDDVSAVSPAIISAWLSGLKKRERTRRNYRDVLGYFNRWLVLRGYLAKGTDWLEGVEKYKSPNHEEITTYTPDEITKLLTGADKRLVPFLAIGAFAGLRHWEISRLDWAEVELNDQAESFIEVRAAKSNNKVRRLVPVHDNLKAWLLPLRKDSGAVCDYANITKQLLARGKSSGVAWKKNALRHSFISYRVAECADVPRTADEAGNSPAIIKESYLRRVKPELANKWFAVMPPPPPKKKERLPKNIIKLKVAA